LTTALLDNRLARRHHSATRRRFADL